jgi:hypothetical protein
MITIEAFWMPHYKSKKEKGKRQKYSSRTTLN